MFQHKKIETNHKIQFKQRNSIAVRKIKIIRIKKLP